MTSTEASLHVRARSHTRARAGSRLRSSDVVFGTGLAALLGWAAWCGRGTWVFIDEWSILTRYHDGQWLEPFNGHLSLVPVAIYRVLLEMVGYAYGWYRLVGLLCYAAVAVAVYLFARVRVEPLVAALAALLVAWSSQAELMIMFPLLLNFSVPIAAVVTIWILLDRDRPGADVAASVLMAVALASSAVGVLAPITVGTDLLVRRERRLRRWLTFLPPVALWVLWYLQYDLGETGAGGTIGEVSRFAGRELLATFSGFVGGWTPGGVALIVATSALVGAAIVRWKTFDRRALTIVATLAGFVVLTAAGRNSAASKFDVAPIAADSDRYLWVNGLLVICLVVHCLRGRRIPVVALAAATVLALANGAVLARNLADYGDTGRQNVKTLRTLFAAVDAVGDRVDRARSLPLGFIPVPTPDYLGLVEDFGTPFDAVRTGPLSDELVRTTADGWMIDDLGLRIVRDDAAADAACPALPSAPSSRGAAVEAPARLVVHAGNEGATVRVRRLARHFDAAPIGSLAPGRTGALRLPADRSARSWHVQVSGTDTQVRACAGV